MKIKLKKIKQNRADQHKKLLWEELPEDFRKNKSINKYKTNELESIVREFQNKSQSTRDEIYDSYYEKTYGIKPVSQSEYQPPTKVHQRKKNDPITVKSSMLPDGEAPMEITAPVKTWQTLKKIADVRNYLSFIEIFKQQFIDPAIWKIKHKPARGIHSDGRSIFQNIIKEVSTWLYLAVKHWTDKDKNRWPAIFTKAIEKMQVENSNIIKTTPHRKHKSYDAKLITAILMENYYGKERKKHGLKKWTDDEENFYGVNIQQNPKFKEIKEYFDELIKECNTPLYIPIPLLNILAFKKLTSY